MPKDEPLSTVSESLEYVPRRPARQAQVVLTDAPLEPIEVDPRAALRRKVNGLASRVAHREGIPVRFVNSEIRSMGFPARGDATEGELREQLRILETRLENASPDGPSAEQVIRNLRELPPALLAEVIHGLITGVGTEDRRGDRSPTTA